MKRYRVLFAASAQEDVARSYEWGCRKWGKQQAQRWLRDLRAATKRQLSLLPRGFPIAPESSKSTGQIRQMVVGRYRVLFTIRANDVLVLHIRGAYPGPDN